MSDPQAPHHQDFTAQYTDRVSASEPTVIDLDQPTPSTPPAPLRFNQHQFPHLAHLLKKSHERVASKDKPIAIEI
jgi:hypothetical protein